MANTVTKYTNGSSFINRIPHLEREKKFGFAKWRANIALGLEGDLQKHDCVNFSQSRVNATSSGFIGSNDDVGESNGIVRDEPFVFTFQQLKVQEHVCKDGV